MLRYLTAGESHGPALTGIIEGLPAGVSIDVARINEELLRRQQVPGRGARMRIESDAVSILSGLRGGITLGSPLSLQITNLDYTNWIDQMHPVNSPTGPKITAPRPGHADYPGVVKYGFDDVRNVLERASARETAMRTAIGAVARQVLELQGVEIYSRILHLGPLTINTGDPDIAKLREGRELPFTTKDLSLREQAVALLDKCSARQESVGGVIEVVAFGVPVGLGSYVQADRRLDGAIAGGLMSIPGVKGVEFGGAFELAKAPPGVRGDSITYCEGHGVKFVGNVNAGLAGGMTTGQPVVVRCAVKPIPTLMPGTSVDLVSYETVEPVRERSDTTAVLATAVVAEAVLGWELLKAFLDTPSRL